MRNQNSIYLTVLENTDTALASVFPKQQYNDYSNKLHHRHHQHPPCISGGVPAQSLLLVDTEPHQAAWAGRQGRQRAARRAPAVQHQHQQTSPPSSFYSPTIIPILTYEGFSLQVAGRCRNHPCTL